MLLGLIKGNRIKQFRLPNKAVGNYWIKDTEDGVEKDLINIEAVNGKWSLLSNEYISVIENDEEKKQIYLKNYSFYVLKNKRSSTYLLLYCCPIYDYTYKKYSLNNISEITIGNSNNNYIYYNNSGVDKVHAKIVLNNSNKYILIDNDSRLGVYVNNMRISRKKELKTGDVIFLAGLKIIFIIENTVAYFIVNNPGNLVKCRLKELKMELINQNIVLDIINESDDDLNVELYKNNDYFYNSYRTKTTIVNTDIDIKQKEVNINLIPTSIIYGPMITIFTISIPTLFISIINSITIGIIISILVMVSIILWPIIIKIQNKKRLLEKDEKYQEYVNNTKKIINNKISEQRNILLNNSITAKDCQSIILEKKESLWSRKKVDDDFLTITLGLSDINSNININSNNEIVNVQLREVPLTISLKKINHIGIIGKNKLTGYFLEQILVQLATLHRYDELKIVMLTNSTNEKKYNYLRILPHCFSNDKKIRFFATRDNEITELSNYLVNEIKYKNNEPYYVVVCDNIHNLYKYSFINRILSADNFSTIIISESMNNDIQRCKNIVSIDSKESIYYENILNGINKKFIIDFNNNINIYDCFKILANIPIDIENEELPESYSLLQMYNVGTIEQLNSYNRWNVNNTELSLKSKIGIDIHGDDIYLDLHKDYNGTHLLVEGIPGSGKTEFITTYILSMAINYSPKDVQFLILCDDKILYNTFNNKLPHIVGCSLYDSFELKRFMTSLKSELISRQKLFANISQRFNKKEMDIYKYKQLYSSGLVKNSMAHLFIVIDEYEQLEKQHPNFINNLFKISHIGPILGVHYLFTTNKTESIKDINIFNSRILMYNINKIDNIVNYPGRFYLKDKNDEIILGMGASSDYIYKPNSRYINNIDTSIEFINNIGKVIKKKDKFKLHEKVDLNNTELNNVIGYLNKLTENENIEIKQLLLDKLEEYSVVASLMKKYDVNTKKYHIEPVVGEYENLLNHTHNILRINLTNNSNIIYSNNKSEYEMFISSMIFSSMYLYTIEELNYYIIDLNNNLLNSFENCPLVADIIPKDNYDKLNSFFEIIKVEIEQRKNLFKDYSGYTDYISSTNNIIPLLIIVINNYDYFNIKYKKYIDNIVNILNINDYGINLVISSTELLPSNISNKFSQIFALTQTEKTIYEEIFDETIINYPSNYCGRGITRISNILCEFQVAHVNPKNKDFISFVKRQCKECSKAYKDTLPNIPLLPDKLTFKQVKHELGKTKEMVIGYNNELKIVKYNFDDKNISVISGISMDVISKFVSPLIKQFAYLNRNDVIVIDPTNNNSISNINNLKYINNDYDNNIELLYNYINNIYSMEDEYIDKVKHRTIIINGFKSFYDNLTENTKLKFSKLINKANKLNIINIIIVDNFESIKQLELQPWYSEINLSDSIWVGKGILKQDVISANNIIDNDIKDNYCYVIEYGIPTLTQYVESFDILEN